MNLTNECHVCGKSLTLMQAFMGVMISGGRTIHHKCYPQYLRNPIGVGNIAEPLAQAVGFLKRAVPGQ